jgi:tRNA A-37 threonylcarbamoyl transferase component Bud32
MAEMQHCEQCGNKMAADAPQGLCPQCLMKLGLPTEAQTPPSAGRVGQGVTHTGQPGSGLFVPPDPKELADQFPQLEIIELLGQGGMGAVYKARQKQLGRAVALKILPPQTGQDPAFAERFNREARSLARLNHPNIVTVYDFGHSPEGLYFFIMEFVEGTDLRKVLSSKQLSPAEALAVVPQICAALQFAHDEGIVHRDIKPENILLDTKGRVKIADFGLARLMNQTEIAFTLTQADQRMGTPHYMAPEQIEHPHQVDHRADIYSLGVVFYEMLTGELPIGRFDPPSQRVQMDVHLDDVVLHTLEKAPDRRYQHASELKTDVEAISKGVAPSVEPAHVMDHDLEAIRRRLKIPAIGLMISGAINIPCLFLLIVGIVTRRFAGLIPSVGIFVIASVTGVFIMSGARRMRRLHSYGWAVTTAILAVLPLSFGFMIGVPMGIWALVVLNRSDVQAAFAAIAKKKRGTKTTHESQSALRTPARDTPVSRVRRVGLLSLIAAILGCVVPILLWIIFWLLEENTDMNPPYSIGVFIFLGLELVALASGIAGWRSPYGKAGTGIAILLLVLCLLTVPFLVTTRVPVGRSPESAESHQMVQPE